MRRSWSPAARRRLGSLWPALLFGCSFAQAGPPPPVYAEAPSDASGPVAVVGDTQRTLLVERLELREQNDEERHRIALDIARRRPALLVVLGDLVSIGSLRSDWQDFDALMAPIRAAGIPLLPALGNHDYWGSEARAIENLRARFPQIVKSRWYSRTYRNLGLVWLDSNAAQLGDARWAEERSWFVGALQAFDAAGDIAGIVVFTHHPPFTNSATTGDEEEVQKAFLPAFFRSRKTLAFVSGHVHAYERFVEKGRTFIVSGGGGGPRVKLLSGPARRHDDLYAAPSPRPFHYLLLDARADGLAVSVLGFSKGEADVRQIDQFSLPFAR